MLKYSSFGKNIKKHREKLGLTQQDLAQKMFVSFQAISAWERGISLPDLENAVKLSEIFKIKLDTLLQDCESNLFIAIDGGGTKTEFLLFEKSGAIRKRVLLESTNPNSVGIEKCITTLKRGIDKLLECSPAKAIFAGISGVTTGDRIPVIQKALSEYYGIQTFVDTDGTNLLAMAKDPENAAIVICGTGSCIFVRKNYVRTRIGGWGYLFDQPGSAYSIGNKALCHTLGVCDGLEEKSELSLAVEEYLGGNVWQKLSSVYEKGVSFIASIAPIVVEKAEKGDIAAHLIIEQDAAELALLIQHARKNYGAPDEFLCAGGFIKNEYFKTMLEKKSQTTLYYPKSDTVVYGACLECLRLCGIQPDENFAANFKESYR